MDSDDDVKMAPGWGKAIIGRQEGGYVALDDDAKMAPGWGKAVVGRQEGGYMAVDDNAKMALGWGRTCVIGGQTSAAHGLCTVYLVLLFRLRLERIIFS